MAESFDNSALRACSKDSSLAKVIPGEETRLDKYFETLRASLRLTLFYTAIIINLGGGSHRMLDDCMVRYAIFQGLLGISGDSDKQPFISSNSVFGLSSSP